MDQLCRDWLAAKQREVIANADRLRIEAAMIAMHPAREEGSETFATAGGMKVTLVGKISYKADVQKLVALTESWPADVRPVKTKVVADESMLKAIRNDRPDLWRKLSSAIETKPAKTGVTVEVPEK
jgi:hypothetical protein